MVVQPEGIYLFRV